MDIRNSQLSQRQSQVVSTMRRSYISSGYTNEYLPGLQDLTRSHIQNQIQSDRKINLTDNLPFVVVFQTMEIERLWKQIEAGKQRVRDLERQTISTGGSDVLLREMSEKMLAHERDKERYSEENEKLNLVCHQLYSELEDMKRKLSDVDFSATDKYQIQRSRNTDLQMELDTWKARYTACERSKTKQLQDMRSMMDSQRKSMIDRDMREMTVRHQTQRSNLENEIRKLRDCLQARNKQLDDTRMQFGHYQAQFAQLNHTQKKLQDYQNKLAMISQQMMRLNQLCKSKQQEIDAFKLKQYQLSQRVKDQQRWELEIKQLRSGIQAKSREIEEWRVKYMRLEDGMLKVKELEKENATMAERVREYERELERGRVGMREKLAEVDEWKRKLQAQEIETNRYKHLQKEIEQYENKITILTTEVERLNNVLKARLTDIEEWKSKHRALEGTINSYIVYEKQNKELNDRLSQQFRILEDVKMRLEKTEGELTTMRMYERKAQDQQDQLRTLTNQIDRVNNIVRSKHQEIEDFKIKQTRLESAIQQYKYTEGKLRDYEDKINSLTQQLQRINNVVRSKNDELQRASYTLRNLEEEVSTLRSNESRIAEHERTIMSLNANLESVKREGSKWEEKFRQIQGKSKQLQSNQYLLLQEKDKISNNLRVKTFELEEIRTKYNKMENDSFRAKEMETSFYDLQSKTMTISTEMERLDRTCRSLEEELHKERNLSMELAFKVIILSAEVQRCQSSGGMKSKDYADMQQKLFYLQSGIKDKDSQVMLLLQKINAFQPKIAYLMGQLDRYLTAITASQKKMRQLQQQIAQYQDYTKRIGILSAEIDRLSGDNKMLDEDTRKMRLKYAGQLSTELNQQKLCMLVVIMGVEIESLRSRLGEKDTQFNEMRRSILEPIRNFDDYRRV